MVQCPRGETHEAHAWRGRVFWGSPLLRCPGVGLKVVTSPSVPEGVFLVLSPGLTPAQGAGTVAPMPDDSTPANSTVPSAPFFEGRIPDFIVPPLEKPILDPTPVEIAAANPTDEELFRTNDIRIFPEAEVPGIPRALKASDPHAAPRLRDVFEAMHIPSVPRGNVTYPTGDGAIFSQRPTATIVMVRTRRPGRQRWTWHLREDHTATKMCFGRFYTNYDEAVAAALASTGGYAVSPVIRGAKPKGRA